MNPQYTMTTRRGEWWKLNKRNNQNTTQDYYVRYIIIIDEILKKRKKNMDTQMHYSRRRDQSSLGGKEKHKQKKGEIKRKKSTICSHNNNINSWVFFFCFVLKLLSLHVCLIRRYDDDKSLTKTHGAAYTFHLVCWASVRACVCVCVPMFQPVVNNRKEERESNSRPMTLLCWPDGETSQ